MSGTTEGRSFDCSTEKRSHIQRTRLGVQESLTQKKSTKLLPKRPHTNTQTSPRLPGRSHPCAQVTYRSLYPKYAPEAQNNCTGAVQKKWPTPRKKSEENSLLQKGKKLMVWLLQLYNRVIFDNGWVPLSENWYKSITGFLWSCIPRLRKGIPREQDKKKTRKHCSNGRSSRRDHGSAYTEESSHSFQVFNEPYTTNSNLAQNSVAVSANTHSLYAPTYQTQSFLHPSYTSYQLKGTSYGSDQSQSIPAFSNYTQSISDPTFHTQTFSGQSSWFHETNQLKPYLGFTGLHNVGNTCYMNSVLQVLANTTQLRNYFNTGRECSIDQRGHLDRAFSMLMRKLWSGEHDSVSPKNVKKALAEKNTTFSDFSQQDAQEFLTNFLNGLDEELPKQKPSGKTIIRDLFEGQLTSSYECLSCYQINEVVEPFMVLPLPLKSEQQPMPVYFISRNANSLPVKYIVPRNKMHTISDLKTVIAQAACVDVNELFVYEIFEKAILRIFDDDESSLEEITPDDTLVVSMLARKTSVHDEVYTIGIIQRKLVPEHLRSQRLKSCSLCSCQCPKRDLRPCTRCWTVAYCRQCKLVQQHDCEEDPELVGFPFFISIRKQDATLCKLRYVVQQLASHSFHPMGYYERNTCFFSLKRCDRKGYTDLHERNLEDQYEGNCPLALDGYEFLTLQWHNKKQRLNVDDKLNSETMDLRDTSEHSEINLNQCFEFLVEQECLQGQSQPVCPMCCFPSPATRETRIKKLPDVLIIQLKRFSIKNQRFAKTNNEIRFPLKDLVVSKYVKEDISTRRVSKVYDLYGVVNHQGTRFGGHYTSHARCPSLGDTQLDEYGKHGGWRFFNDSCVRQALRERLDFKHAYLLFYQRRKSQTLV